MKFLFWIWNFPQQIQIFEKILFILIKNDFILYLKWVCKYFSVKIFLLK
jgi:hypothetical protein